jgi:hypothetical protein
MEGHHHTWKRWHKESLCKVSSISIIWAEVCGQLLGTSTRKEGPAPAPWARQAIPQRGYLRVLHFNFLQLRWVHTPAASELEGLSWKLNSLLAFVQLDAPELAFQGQPKLERIDYYKRLRTAKFCLAPRGESSWTLRFYEAFFVV